MPDDPEEIPLFPLPNVVLFPQSTVPLYVFEPRYRQMTSDALDSHRRIGMVAVLPDSAADMLGNPPLYQVGCEGEIVGAQARDDGTFNIVLRGTRRFRILDESTPSGERLYRTAHVQSLPEDMPEDDAPALGSRRSEMLLLLGELVRRTTPKHAPRFESDRFENVDDRQLVNSLAQALDFDVRDKQQLLEQGLVSERQRVLCELIRFRLAELPGSGGQGSTTLH